MVQKASAAVEARVGALYESGALNKVIAEEVGISRATVARIIKEMIADGRLTPRQERTLPSDDELVLMREQGMSFAEIGEKVGFSFAYIHKRIARLEADGRVERVDARTERHAREKLADPTTPPIVRAMLERLKLGEKLKDLTVLSEGNDPYRVDTPAKKAAARWLADEIARLDANPRVRRDVWWNRGLHYALLGRPKPDGTVYVNNAEDWVWLDSVASKAARRSGLVPFERIEDRKNNPPIIRLREDIEAKAALGHYLDDIDLRPTVYLSEFDARQPYRLALVAEKSSAGDILGPLSERYNTDLFLPDGELTDSQIYLMAKAAADDGRPLVVIYYSDCDPSRYQMPISVSRKVQSLKDSHFPDLEARVVQALLTPEQVIAYNEANEDDPLPTTPLKDPEDEKRGPKWLETFGIEQTELDALTSLRPDLFEAIAVEMIERFYDTNLEREVRLIREEWDAQAQAVIDALADSGEQARLRAEGEAAIAALRRQIEADLVQADLPEVPELPESDLDPGDVPNTVLDPADDWRTQTRKLIDRKRYAEED